MATTEHGRLTLYRHFEAEMGEEKAKVLMDHLLPVGWTDLATKQDLREIKQELVHLRETMATKVELEQLRAEMYKGFRTQTLALVGLMVTLQGLTVATLRLI